MRIQRLIRNARNLRNRSCLPYQVMRSLRSCTSTLISITNSGKWCTTRWHTCTSKKVMATGICTGREMRYPCPIRYSPGNRLRTRLSPQVSTRLLRSMLRTKLGKRLVRKVMDSLFRPQSLPRKVKVCRRISTSCPLTELLVQNFGEEYWTLM